MDFSFNEEQTLLVPGYDFQFTLYLGDEDDADDGSAFGDDDIVPPPPPPLPSEPSTARPEPSVPRPPRTEVYFGANVYDRSPRPDEPGGRLFI